MKKHKTLLFVSPRFLFPVDSGGKIRTTQILRGLKRGSYEIVLACPASAEQVRSFASEIATVCDRLAAWHDAKRRLLKVSRITAVTSSLPIPVATDRSSRGTALVRAELDAQPDVVVFDFPHSAVLAPPKITVPSVLFTHNVEAEIFRRHASVASWPLSALWRQQLRKMLRFERDALRRFDTVIAVSQRDAKVFGSELGVSNVRVIQTGVDLGYFAYAPPTDAQHVVFTGSMDWLANRDGIEFFMDEVWPLIARRAPDARMTVVGRDPPASLVDKVRDRQLRWRFTGFVDDVREHVRGAGISVIPLRVGGGTRLKVYEAMAIGTPVVSTTIGVEGLPLIPEAHYLCADSAHDFAAAVLRLMTDAELRRRLSATARAFVEAHSSYERVAEEFERICDDTVQASLPLR